MNKILTSIRGIVPLEAERPRDNSAITPYRYVVAFAETQMRSDRFLIYMSRG